MSLLHGFALAKLAVISRNQLRCGHASTARYRVSACMVTCSLVVKLTNKPGGVGVGVAHPTLAWRYVPGSVVFGRMFSGRKDDGASSW